jgi:hypothetical protein
MKYIRLKNGTIELNREEIEREIIKEADTIKDLCDMFVVEYQTKKKNIFGSFNKAYEEYIECPIDMGGFNLYGAVWTDKGLIYVAKLNRKGEWELL